jgi:hypothetical protein
MYGAHLGAMLAACLIGTEPVAEPPPAETTRLRPPPEHSIGEYLGSLIGLAPSAPDPIGAQPALNWHLLPFVVANPLVGAGAGVAAVGVFEASRAPGTPYSTFASAGLVTTNGQSSLSLLTQVWFAAGDWMLDSDLGLSHFPNPAWGLGGDTPDSNRTIVGRREVRFHESVFRRIAGHLFAGVGLFLDDFWDITDRSAAQGTPTAFTDYGIGVRGRSLSPSVVLDLLFDSRDASVNPTAGLLLLARYRQTPAWLGNQDAWRSFYLDARAYLPVARQADTLAFWAIAWSTSGSTPYLLLPAVGGDPERRSARGFIEARHVGKDLLYAEVEYRARLWQFLGAVGGLNAHAVSGRGLPEGSPSFGHWSLAAVLGLRLTLDRQSQSALALDAALTSTGDVAGYVAFNEAF